MDAPLRVSQVFLSPCRDFNCSIAALLNFCLVYRDFSEMMNSSISFQFDVEENYFQIIKQIALVISHSVEPLLIFASKVLLSLCNFILMLLINCICSQMMHHVFLLIFSSLLLLPFKGVAGIKFKRSFYLKKTNKQKPHNFSVSSLCI